ncbi:peptidyl-prolyl cis-trans isomerase [Chitinimonas prasina]|uniref:Peptidyl-prolyl cis-trans isomerase n=1 Tax=Chitinimonas prasina TaxID=1434937 RepID=A0ABQ5Y8P9_9NEIS|nr:peptidylprolyl isomerase [Chitinimonas prasina]GLR11310.1 peptidyl-prolyl cis-trans isomerase [Chitinimonas prasina]
MKKLLLAFALVLAAPAALAANPLVRFTTNQGDIDVELFQDKAPKSVANFLAYVKKGHYNGTIFHRVIPGFVVQGGGFTPDMREKPTGKPIENEAKNGLSNAIGTLAMARTMDPHSASAQFYVNVGENVQLDYREESPRGWGYAVFGKVIAGMDVVEKIAAEPTSMINGMRDVPVKPIIVKSAKQIPDTRVAKPAPAVPPAPTPAADPAKQ